MEKKQSKRIELTGGKRAGALGDCLAQIESWGLRMPEEEPVVRDFGLGDFYKNGEIEFWIANRMDEGYCGKFIFVFDSETCPYHYHKIKHETFYIVKGKVSMNINGKHSEKREGDVVEMPVGCKHSFTGIGPALILEVSKPSLRGDSYFEDPAIGVF